VIQLLFSVLLVALSATSTPGARDGRHDFDFEIGTWKMEPSGYGHVVRKLWDGATIAQLIVLKPSRHVRGSLLSIYTPASRQWSIYWADAEDGTLSPPLVGHFHDGVGTFVGHDTIDGRAALTRLRIFDITPRTFQTVQAESRDGGHTWRSGETTAYIRQH
jgi:hypothetical protein